MKVVLIIFGLLLNSISFAQKSDDSSNLYEVILKCDSLLFNVGFNQIDTAQVGRLISTDFEFYHDIHGITDSRDAFLNGIQGLSEMNFTTWRVLVDGSMEVFPMYKNNHQDLYAVIQNGIHEFYQKHPGQEAFRSSVARFSQLWILENGEWKLKRVLSYDHQTK